MRIDNRRTAALQMCNLTTVAEAQASHRRAHCRAVRRNLAGALNASAQCAGSGPMAYLAWFTGLEAVCIQVAAASCLNGPLMVRGRKGFRIEQGWQACRKAPRRGARRSQRAFHAAEERGRANPTAPAQSSVAAVGCRYTRRQTYPPDEHHCLAYGVSGDRWSRPVARSTSTCSTYTPPPRRQGWWVRLQQCNLEVHVLGKIAHRIAVTNAVCPSYPFALHWRTARSWS